MRIVLEKTKQRELIEKAKLDSTWDELSKMLNINPHYLSTELRKEQTYLSEEVYRKLCNIINKNFDKFIIKKLENNWGQIKGANITSRNTKEFEVPKESDELAELFGAILGDGHLEEIKRDKKVRCYSVTITGDSSNDKDYILNHIKDLFKRVFNETGRLFYVKNKRAIFLRVHGKKIIEFVKKKGINPGNKKDNNQGIPDWIKSNADYLKVCIRGLIDTDGSVHYISKTNKNLRISFTSHIPKLLMEVRNSLIGLGFSPSKIIRERQVFLSSKYDISKYIKDIGFKNQKHLKRLESLQRRMLL